MPIAGRTTRWSPTTRPTWPTAVTTRPSSTGWPRCWPSSDASSGRDATPASSFATRTRTAATCSPDRTWPPGRRRSASSRRATSSGTRRAHACGPTAIQRASFRTSPTSTSSSCAARTPDGSPSGDALHPQVGRQDIGVDIVGGVREGPVGSPAGADVHDVAEGHPMDPALAPVGAENSPERARSLDQLDLVALVEQADLVRPQLVRSVQQADHPVLDPAPLAALERVDDAVIERELRGDGGLLAERVRLAGRHEGGTAPPGHAGFIGIATGGRTSVRLGDAGGGHDRHERGLSGEDLVGSRRLAV